MNINPNIKNVPVNFEQNIKIALFNQKAYNNIKTTGHSLTDLNLIHSASIHYQSRFQSNIPRRFKATLDVIEPSLIDERTGFYFSDIEDSELQKQS